MFLDDSLKIVKVCTVVRLFYSISALPYHLSQEKNRNNSFKQDFNQHNVPTLCDKDSGVVFYTFKEVHKFRFFFN